MSKSRTDSKSQPAKSKSLLLLLLLLLNPQRFGVKGPTRRTAVSNRKPGRDSSPETRGGDRAIEIAAFGVGAAVVGFMSDAQSAGAGVVLVVSAGAIAALGAVTAGLGILWPHPFYRKGSIALILVLLAVVLAAAGLAFSRINNAGSSSDVGRQSVALTTRSVAGILTIMVANAIVGWTAQLMALGTASCIRIARRVSRLVPNSAICPA